MDTEPVLQEEKPMSKLVFWLLGLLVVGAIFAAAAFMYYRDGDTDNSNDSISTEQSTTESDINTDISQSETDLTALGNELDQELAEIDESLASTEDDTSDL